MRNCKTISEAHRVRKGNPKLSACTPLSAMASAEQPLKKRKLYEPQSQSQSEPEPAPTPSQTLAHGQSVISPSPLSHEEILKKRRNRDEIRSVYDCYKRIKFCLAQNDSVLTPELEQVYLSLITASRGLSPRVSINV